MQNLFRQAALTALLGLGLNAGSYAQRGGNFLGFASVESDKVSVALPAPSGPFTLEAWVYFSGSSFANSGYHAIMEFGDDSDWFGVGDVGELYLYGSAYGGTVPVRQWAHVAFSWDGTTSRLYINGTEVAAANDALDPTGTHLGIGHNSGDTGWQGYIDEVMVWNVARTAAQIQSDGQNGAAANALDLLSYFKFDEGSGQAVLNQVAGGPSGTLGSTANPDTNDPVRVNSVVNAARTPAAGAVAQLQPNFPNPFADATTVPFVLHRAAARSGCHGPRSSHPA